MKTIYPLGPPKGGSGWRIVIYQYTAESMIGSDVGINFLVLNYDFFKQKTTVLLQPKTKIKL